MIFFVAPGVWIFPFTKIIKFRMPIGNPLLFKYAIFFSSFHCIPAYWFMPSVTKREEKSIRVTGICQGADFGRSKGKDK